MMKATKAPSTKTAQTLLEKYECPVPYHEVRTRFLGDIATPAISAPPLQIIKALWGGELPTFDSIEDVNELLDALVQGLWNELTRHQKRNQPFRLARVATESTADDLGRYGLGRLQELNGFIEGLFNGEGVIDLPERAHEAIGRLAEMRAMMAGICELVPRDLHADDRTQLGATFKHLRELTRIMETEIHEAVLSCSGARHQMIDGVLTEKPTVH